MGKKGGGVLVERSSWHQTHTHTHSSNTHATPTHPSLRHLVHGHDGLAEVGEEVAAQGWRPPLRALAPARCRGDLPSPSSSSLLISGRWPRASAASLPVVVGMDGKEKG